MNYLNDFIRQQIRDRDDHDDARRLYKCDILQATGYHRPASKFG